MNCKLKDVTITLKPPNEMFIRKKSLEIKYDNGLYDITFTWNLGLGGDDLVYKARGVVNQEGTKMSYFTIDARLPEFYGIKGVNILIRGDIDFCSKKLVITSYDENTDKSGNIIYTESVKPIYNKAISDLYKSYFMTGHKLANKETITLNDVLEFREVKVIDFEFSLGDEKCISESLKNEIKMEQFSIDQNNIKELCDSIKHMETMIKGFSENDYTKDQPIGKTYGVYSKFCLSDSSSKLNYEWLNKKLKINALSGIANMAKFSFTSFTVEKDLIITTFKIHFFVGEFSFEFKSKDHDKNSLILESKNAKLPLLAVTDIELTINFENKKMTLKSVDKDKENANILNGLAQMFGLDTFSISLTN